MDFIRGWSEKAEIPLGTLLGWAELYSGTFNKWTRSYGKAYEHNGKIPRDHWLTDAEKRAILDFYAKHPLEGYRRLTYMMMDADVVACSPASVYRVLRAHGLLRRFAKKSSRKGQGFAQPGRPNSHWHIDVSYLNISGTFYYCVTILDGYSRMVIHWDIREQMKEIDVESILQRAREHHPEATPRIISDNGPQFIAKDFKAFIRFSGMTHVRTSPFYPQSNGKLERYHKTMKSECIRPETPLSLADAKRSMARFVERYNCERLHSGIGYVTPRNMFEGRQKEIHAERDRKIEAARQRRAEARAALRESECYTGSTAVEDKALLGSNLSAAAMPMTGASAPSS